MPRSPWSMTSAIVLMDFICVVVALWNWTSDSPHSLLGVNLLIFLWLLCIDRELRRGWAWIRVFVTIAAVTSLPFLVKPSVWRLLCVCPLVFIAALLWLPQSGRWLKEVAAAECQVSIPSWRKALRIFYRTLLTIPLVVLLAIAGLATLELPGMLKYERLCSYPSKEALLAAEPQAVKKVIDFSQYGANYTAVVLPWMRFLASGPAVFIYDSTGKRVDECYDSGEDGSFVSRWHY